MRKGALFAGLLFLPLWSWAVAHTNSLDLIRWDAGPFFAQWQDVHRAQRCAVAGPFFETAAGGDDLSYWAIRPLMSHMVAPAQQTREMDILWPLFHWRRALDEQRWNFLLIMTSRRLMAEANTNSALSPYHSTWLIPFYFQGRDRNGRAYGAVFPLGGRIRHVLNFDVADFVIFPLWSRTQTADTKSQNIVWPFISWTHGGGDERWRFFPFYGRSQRKGIYDNQFVAWPLLTLHKSLPKPVRGGGYIIWPFFGKVDRVDQKTWMIFPPFFRYHVAKEGTLLYAPWPFIQRKTGETDLFYLWPLYGQRRIGNAEKTWVLWPIFSTHKTDSPTRLEKSWQVTPIFQMARMYDQSTNVNARDFHLTDKYYKCWPLFTYRQERENARLRAPDLWPLKELPAVERNWSPFWTLFEQNRFGDAVDRRALWGLYRKTERGSNYRRSSVFPVYDWGMDARSGNTTTQWSLFKGLLGYQEDQDCIHLRLLYFFEADWKNKEIKP